jgi:hypothetical protein
VSFAAITLSVASNECLLSFISSSTQSGNFWVHPRKTPRTTVKCVLLRGSARPYTAADTVQTLQKLHFHVLEHSLHSPELVPSDYLSGVLKNALKGCDHDLNEAVHMWLLASSIFFFH